MNEGIPIIKKFTPCTIFLVLHLLIAPSSQAQFYATAGYSFSNIQTDLIETDGVGRSMVGLGGRMTLNSHNSLFIQTEGTFSGKGFKYSDNANKELVKFYYLTAPVTLLFKPGSGVSLEGGFEIAGLISARFESRRFNESIEVNETYSSWDLGAVAGLGFLENKRIRIGLRYIHGLKTILEYPLFDDFGNITGEINDVNNKAFQLVLKIALIK